MAYKLINKATGKELREGDEIPWHKGTAHISAIDPRGTWVWIIREHDENPLPCFANTLNAKYVAVPSDTKVDIIK